MREFMVTLTRNIGIGNDIINFFENRGHEVIFEDREVLPKTFIVKTNSTANDLMKLKYVQDAKEVRTGTVFV